MGIKQNRSLCISPYELSNFVIRNRKIQISKPQYKQNAKDKAEAEKKESDNGLSDTQEISQNTLSKDHEI